MILITGASGTVGRELVKRLARPEQRIRVMVRDRDQAGSVAYPGVDVVSGDFAVVQTLDDALSGIDKAFLLAPPVPEQLDYETNFLEAASRSNLRHIVKQSAMGAAPDSPSRFFRAHAESEARLRDSGIPYTILRPNQFMQNFLNSRDTIIHRGEFYAPMGEGRISIVDVRDVAAAAAEVLTTYGHEDKVYDITGPESLTYAEIASRFSEELGKPVAYVDVPPEKMGEAMLQNGLPQWTVDALLELYALWKFNNASDIETIGHIAKAEPTTFRQFARDYATQFGLRGRDPHQKLMDVVTFDSMTPGK